MKVFREMVDLVTKQSLQKIEVIDESTPLNKENLYLQLFKGISDGSISTDEEAASIIYQTSPTNKKYQMLKSRLKDRLTNSLFFLNHKKIHDSPFQQAAFLCNKNYFCAKILLTHGARTSAIAMAKSTLTLAEKFDINEITLLCSRMLRNHYAMAGMKRDHQYYSEKVSGALKKIRAESRAEFMYETLVVEYGKSKAHRPELATKAKEYFEQCKELAKYQDSFHLHLSYYRTGMLYYQIVRNYQSLLSLCSRFQDYLKKHPEFYRASLEGEIALLKLGCCFNLRDYKNGKVNADEALKHYVKGRNNWFTVMENYFLLTMHTEKFEEALDILEETTHEPRFQYMDDAKKEAWKIYEAYLNYLLPGNQKLKDFKLLKFLNEVPIYSKDKTGYYAAILIAQILYLIDRWDEDGLEKKIESLRIFSLRNLSGNTAPRTFIFIKMLRQLLNNNYDFKKVKIKTNAAVEKLEGAHSKQVEVDTMEIIPYEKIWTIILNRLQEKRTLRR